MKIYRGAVPHAGLFLARSRFRDLQSKLQHPHGWRRAKPGGVSGRREL